MRGREFWEKLKRIRQQKFEMIHKHCRNFKTKKSIIGVVSLSLLVVVAILVVLLLNYSNKTNKKSRVINDPELARAMTYGEFTEEDEKTESDCVRFGAFFLRDLDGDGYAEKVKGTCKKVGESDYLYFSLNVLTEGTLKNGKIEIQGDNIYFQTALIDDEVISGNYISNNTSVINLKDVGVGTQKLIFGNARSGNYNNKYEMRAALGNDTTKYSRENKIILTGTHVANDGTETNIRKEIVLPVDWYEETKAEIPYTYAGQTKNKYQSYNTENVVDEAKGTIKISFKLVSQETQNKLILSKAYIEGTIPDFNGYSPLSVEFTGTNVKYTYDEETGKYTAWRDSVLDASGKILSEANSGSYDTLRYNEFNVMVEYPLEAYATLEETITYKVPIKAYYEGYNNPNEEFSNPYRSNIAEDIIVITYTRGGGDVIGYSPTVGQYVGSPYNTWVVSKESAAKKYNNVEGEAIEKETYEVRWEVVRGAEGTITGFKIYEPENNYEDRFIKTDGTEEGIVDITNNVGIYFTNLGGMFGENGYVKLIDNDTNTLIHTFTKDDWDIYTKESPYLYDYEVKHIRLETSEADKGTVIGIYQVKEIDNNKLLEKYQTKEDFDKISKIASNVIVEAQYGSDLAYTKLTDKPGYANYDEPLSIASISNVTPSHISTQETAENVKITISTVNLGYNVKEWKNATFLLKFPEEVILTEINNVNISNSNIKILGYDIYQENGVYFLKILTENDIATTFNIIVDCNITPDPRKLTANRNIELYAYNEECHNYKEGYKAVDTYDINADNNTVEYMDYSKKEIGFVGPSSLLTTETASDYDGTGNTLETAIAPQIAIIDKEQETKTAKVSVQILNNYSGNITEVKVVGKIPFEGNTFQLNASVNLGSTYTTTLTGPIVLPEALQPVAKVYYSENEVVTEDLTDEQNGWTENVTDYSKIKTYLIDLQDYSLSRGEEYICTYEIEIPNTVNYNDVAYSTHGVYFALETDEGKLRDKTETNKLGFMIARKYNLDIYKTKFGTEKSIQGAIFSIQEEGEENSRILATNIEGKVTLRDLYVDRIYTIKEIRAPYDYVLNGEEIKFIVTVEDGELVVTKLSGVVKDELTVIDGEIGKTVVVNVENEPKYTLKLTKYEAGTTNIVSGVRFKITGKGLPSVGRTATTNKNGEITISGLYPGETYTLVEEYAKGYEYSEEEIQFKTVWSGSELQSELISGNFKDEPEIDNTQEKQPIMSVSLENTKLREYSFELIKFEKDTNEALANATFKLTGKWMDEEFTTDENGLAGIPTLYENIEYTLEEVMAPDGYAVNDNKIKFKGEFDDETKSWKIIILEGELENSNVEEYELLKEGTILDNQGNELTDKLARIYYGPYSGYAVFQLGFADEPLFKLIKTDGTTQEPLPNVKFAIKKINDDETEEDAKDTAGNIIGEEEKINGETYHVIKTDEKGEIKEDLPEGLYKVIEVETLEGYEFSENVEDRTYYFGIGKSKAAVKEAVEMWNHSIEGNAEITYTGSVPTSDGGYIYVGFFANTISFDEDKTTTNNAISFTSTGSYDGIIIKYNANNKIEWAKQYKDDASVEERIEGIELVDSDTVVITGYRWHNTQNKIFHLICNINNGDVLEERVDLAFPKNAGADFIKGIKVTNDGGYIEILDSQVPFIVPASNSITGEEMQFETRGGRDAYIVKYNSEHKVEWVKQMGGANDDYFYDAVSNEKNEVIVVGEFRGEQIEISSKETENGEEIVLTNPTSNPTLHSKGILIKYNSNGKVVWAKKIGNPTTWENYRNILKIEDGRYILTGYLGTKNTTIPEECTSSNMPIEINGVNIVAQINDEGLIDYAQGFSTGDSAFFKQGDANSDGGYVLAGQINSINGSKKIESSQTADGNEINFDIVGNRDILIAKFNSEHKVVWAKSIGSVGIDNVISINELEDGRYLLKAQFAGKTTIPTDKSIFETEKVIYGSTTLIYNQNGIIEYADSEQGNVQEYVDVVETDDGGNIAVGKFKGELKIPAEETADGKQINLISEGGYDSLIVKYNNRGKIEWIKQLGQYLDDAYTGIEKVDDGYIVVGYYKNGNIIISSEETESGNEVTLTNVNSGSNGILIKYKNDGKVEWVQKLEGTTSETIMDIEKSDDGYVIVGYTSANSKITIPKEDVASTNEDIVLMPNGGEDAFIVKYNFENKVEWAKYLGKTGNNRFNKISIKEDEYVIIGSFDEDFTISASETIEGKDLNVEAGKSVIVKCNNNGKVEYSITNNFAKNDMYVLTNGVIHVADGGYIVVGSYFSNTLLIPANNTLKNEEISLKAGGAHTGYIIKYNSEGLVEFARNFSGGSNIGLEDIFNTRDGGYVLVGRAQWGVRFNAEETLIGKDIWDNTIAGRCIVKYNNKDKMEYYTDTDDTNGGTNYSGVENIDGSYVVVGRNAKNTLYTGAISEFSENTISAEIPAQQVINVENTKKQYQITTEVKGVGGTITGSEETPYEIVIHGEDNIKEIKITPEEGYKILKITVNDNEIEFVPEEDGSYIIPTFENIQENKHIVVEFSNTVSDVIVHHYKEGTTESVAEDELFHGNIGENYTTSPKVDLEEYEVVVEKIPLNASGVYIEEVQEVIYYYKERTVTLTVHHYLEGTTQEISNQGYELEFNKGEEYTTEAATNLDEKYELVEIPANSCGIIIEDTIVNYYYRIKKFNITTKVEGEGGNILGNQEKPYEEVEYGSNSTKEIIITPNEGYQVSSIIVNGVEIIFTPNEDKTVDIDKFIDVTEDKEVIVKFERIPAKVIVHHYEEGTENSVAPDEEKDGLVGDVFATKISDQIPTYYEYVSSIGPTQGTYIEEIQEVTYYYRLRKYEYSIEYYYEGMLDDTKTEQEMATYGEEIITYIDKNIDGYKLEKTENLPLIIGENLTTNVIKIYYIKLDNLTYTVNYLEKDTNKVLSPVKTVPNQTFENVINSNDEIIDIDGYNYDSVDKDTLIITTGENIINIYYTKRTNLSYTVNYLEKDTNKVLSPVKTVPNQTFENVINSNDEIIGIDGYNYDSVDKNTLIITTGENVINIYYTKRIDLSYKVNYLEKDTNKVLNPQKIVNNVEFESVINSSDEVISIDGYNYDSVDKDILTITTGENVINIYYTKRTDLSYRVNYLEKGTNGILHVSKVQDGMTFEDIITASDEIISIAGYNYDSVDKDILTITTGENVINIYYTKRADLSYTVNYLEKDTNKVLNVPITVGGQRFENVIISSDEVIIIDGYNYDSVDKDTLTITTGENVINIYYTKRTDLSYQVNYLEEDTNKVLNSQKIVNNVEFESVINSSDEVIEIDGYNYDSVDKEILTITTGTNEINIYYTKRADLSYQVNYLEKDTNKVLNPQKIVNNVEFETEIISLDEVITIDGYRYDSADKDTLTITTGLNEINVYYTKRNDLSYTVKYLEKGTNKVLKDSKLVENMTLEDEVISSDEIIEIYGYNYDSVDKDILTISTGLNEINIYYTKKDTKVTVHYYEEGTTNKVSEDVEIPGKVFDSYTTTEATDIPSKYELIAVPQNSTGEMTEEEIVVTYYYRKKVTQVIVHYYEEGTTNKLSENVVIDGRVDDPYTTESATDVPIKYELVADPENKVGTMTEEVIEVIYYYRVKDAILNIRYLEKGTDIVLAEPEQQIGKVDENYITTEKPIEGYTLVEDSGNTTGTLTVEPITVTFYYLYNTKATVQYIDKITGEILDERTEEGLEGDEFATDSKDFENYILVEEPVQKTVNMTKEEIVLKYYYIHISGGVIEKHIDVISGEILANDVHTGNEGDLYDIPSRTFVGYDLVEDRLPANSQGTMQVNPIEVTYYYIYKTKVTAKYIDKATGEELTTEEEQIGHETDRYTTERKIFDDYKLEEVPINADGEMTKEEIVVTYYYIHTSGGVIVNHIDINTGKQLLDETKQEGYEGDSYETHEENIPNYDLVEEKYPENSKGTMTKEEIRVTYYYIKKTEVTVKYIDSETGEEIEVQETIPGHEGDDYETEAKEIPGYDLSEEPENKEGEMTSEPTEVVYYYKRPAKVIVRYLDEETKEELAKEEKIEGHQNEEYTTEVKDIQYYALMKLPENAEGKMIITVTKDEEGKEVVEDTTYVTYYYRKKIFNLKIDKQITSIIVNGEEKPVSGNLGKVEVNKTLLSTTNIQVVYKIIVTNNSELNGNATIVENIPEGMIMKAEKNIEWKVEENTAKLDTEILSPGESKEYKVVLDWTNNSTNVGTKENIVSIETTENEAGYEEKTINDNESKADLIISIGTGIGVKTSAISGGIILIVLSSILVVMIDKKRKNKSKQN